MPRQPAYSQYHGLRPRSLFWVSVYVLSLLGLGYTLPLLNEQSSALVQVFQGHVGGFDADSLTIAFALLVSFSVAEMAMQVGFRALRIDGYQKVRRYAASDDVKSSAHASRSVKAYPLPDWVNIISQWYVVAGAIFVVAGILSLVPMPASTVELATYLAGGVGILVAGLQAYLQHCRMNARDPYFDEQMYGELAGSTFWSVTSKAFCVQPRLPPRADMMPRDSDPSSGVEESKEGGPESPYCS